MAREKRLVIPVFVPFAGCPHQCVYCDQPGLTGGEGLPSRDEVVSTVEAHLATWKGRGPAEVAFYGGTFTALPMRAQEEYLESVSGYLTGGLIQSIRVSTRPDAVTDEIVSFIAGRGVKTVELGAQSFSDDVLRKSGRGHSAADTVNSVRILKGRSMTVGLQLMPGLPGDTVETIVESASSAIELGPDFVRIYPTVVLKGTPLHKMYLNGSYRPWTLGEMAAVCGRIIHMFKKEGIGIIRVGLQATDRLNGMIAAGPYHPSFRQLAEKSFTDGLA